MSALARFLKRLWQSMTRRDEGSRFQDEMADHVERQIDDHVRAGMSPQDARRQALLQFGPIESVRDSHRDEHRLRFLETLLADLRYAGRVMFRAPSFAGAVVGVLALGIATNTAIFSLVNAVLLRPLPLDEPHRLVRLFTTLPSGDPFDVAPGKFADWQRGTRSFSGMALYSCCGYRELAFTGAGTPRAIRTLAVSGNFFDVVRAQPAIGRVFRAEDDAPGVQKVVVLSAGFWKTDLGGNPDVIGRPIRLNDTAYTVIGVMPAGVSIPSWPGMGADVWIPLALSQEARASRGNHNLDSVARLNSGVTLADAQADLNTLSTRLAREYPRTDDRWGAVAVPLQDTIVGDNRAMLFMLLGAVGLVLLIACANVGNLFVTRALNRRKEIAVRAALGAGRRRVFQQLMTEALVLSLAGGAVGFVLTAGVLSSIRTLLVAQLPRADEIAMDGSVLLFTLSISVLTGVLIGILPALRAGRSDLNDVLKEGGRGQGSVAAGTRRILIICEVALSFVLLMGAAVLIQTLIGLTQANSGFDPNNVLTMRVRLVPTRYGEYAQRVAFYDTALQRLRAVPGVEAAGTIDDLPLTVGSSQTLTLEGYPPQSQPVALQVRQVTPGYLRAMGIPVLRGRDVVETDAAPLLISAEAARLYWGDDDPIGRRASLPFSRTVMREVVGIVGDVKQRSLTDNPTPTVYYATREPSARATFVIRTAVPPTTVVQSAIAAFRAIDPDQPVSNIQTMVEVRDGTLMSRRLGAVLLGVFAAAALLLSGVGIYSVLSYLVRGRSREIGIRTALGAGVSQIVRLVVVEAVSPVLLGISFGLMATLASAKALGAFSFGVSAYDASTLALVGGTLTFVALIASAVPAYRASQIDPARALRAD
jgi:putative ABC transport system permease protein